MATHTITAKKRILMSSVAAAAMMMAVSAQAADPFEEGVSNPPFLGFYLGGHVGYGGAEYSGVIDTGQPDERATFDNNGFLAGVHAGYNWEVMHNMIAGIEGDITLTPWGGSDTHPDASEDAFVSGQMSGIASLRGRLGFLMDDTLAYATGGIAFASSQGSAGQTQHFNDRAEIVVGGVVGGGLERMISPSVSIRAEGLYYMFDQTQSPNGTASGLAGINNTWQARIGASWYYDNGGNQVYGAEPIAEFAGTRTGFEGWYIGTHTGYGVATYEGETTNNGPIVSVHDNGFFVGAHAGYNWDMGNRIITGIEGDITLAPWSAAATDTDSTNFVAGHLSGIASLRGRVGVDLDRALIYATGGVAFASSQTTGAETLMFSDRTKIVTGGVVGGGIEVLTDRNMSIRAEALYYIFNQGNQNNPFSDGFGRLENAWMTRIGASWYIDHASSGEPIEIDRQGFYAGGHVGFGGAEYTGYVSGAGTGTVNPKGYLAGAHAGYNWDVGNDMLAGIEGDITLMPWSTATDIDSTDIISGHLSGVASIRGRLGMEVNRSLIYATGGIAFASSNAAAGDSIQFNDRAEIITGGVAGGGVEYMVNENLGIRAEGLTYWFDQSQSAAEEGSSVAGITHSWAARLGATWYFN